MEYIVRRSFWDYEKEEKWLNEMSEKGYSLIECGLFRYVFEEGSPSKYIYRIDLCQDEAEINRKLQDGAEMIARNKKLVYYRKPVEKGDFKVSTDKERKRRYFEKRFALFYCLMIMQIALGVSNIIMALDLPLQGLLFSIFIGVIMITFGMFIAVTIIKPLHQKMKRLRHDG